MHPTPLAEESSILSLLTREGSTRHDELLLVALLLTFWLLVRVRRQEQTRRPPPRRAPTSPQELGQIVFQVARSRDLLAWRGLFLAGGEAASVFGASAGAYLERRSLPVLTESLESLAALIPEGSRYDGVEPVGESAFSIWVAPPAGERMQVGIGTAVKVGAIWRLCDPPFLGQGALPLAAAPGEPPAAD